jgi:microcystin-dependent protein
MNPYIGEIRIFTFNFPPRGWALCNGQTMAIQQNQALFSLLGTTYGGNGTTTFMLPNLQGRMPIHFGSGFTQGQVGGEVGHTLTIGELPSHNHLVSGSTATATQTSPSGAVMASGTHTAYASAISSNMNPAAVTNTGGSQAHPNLPPYLTVNFCIAITGIFPSRS